MDLDAAFNFSFFRSMSNQAERVLQLRIGNYLRQLFKKGLFNSSYFEDSEGKGRTQAISLGNWSARKKVQITICAFSPSWKSSTWRRPSTRRPLKLLAKWMQASAKPPVKKNPIKRAKITDVFIFFDSPAAMILCQAPRIKMGTLKTLVSIAVLLRTRLACVWNF